MKHFVLRLSSLSLLATFLAVSADASASCAYMDGYVATRLQLDLGSGTHMVPRDAPVGTVLHEVTKGWADTFYASCTAQTSTARHWDLPTTPLPLVAGNTYATGVQGVGVMVVNQGTPFPTSAAPLAGSTAMSYRWGGQKLTYRFVKTGPIGGGTVNSASLPTVRHTFDDHRLLIYDAAAVGSATFVVGSCETPDVQVDMGAQKLGDFAGIGTRVGMRDFDIAINNCPAGLTSITYSLAAVNGVANATAAVARLATSSTATGVGLQITNRNDNPMTFGVARTAPAYDPATGGSIKIPLRAWYYQTDAAIAAGTAEGYVEFTMSYQ